MAGNEKAKQGADKAASRKLWKHPAFLVVVACTALPYFRWPTEIPAALARGPFAAAFLAQRPPPSPSQRDERPIPARSRADDPIQRLLTRIRSFDFSGAETLMTGRCLRAYKETRDVTLLATTDLSAVRLAKRGERWMFVEAPYTPPEALYVDRFPWEKTAASIKRVRMRLVEQEGGWKLEHVKVVGEG